MMARPRPDSGSRASARSSSLRSMGSRCRRVDGADDDGKGHCTGGRRRNRDTERIGVTCLRSAARPNPRPVSTTSSTQVCGPTEAVTS